MGDTAGLSDRDGNTLSVEFGVGGRLFDLGGPSGSSSARNDERSTVSKNDIAASRLTRQYAASPSTLLLHQNMLACDTRSYRVDDAPLYDCQHCRQFYSLGYSDDCA